MKRWIAVIFVLLFALVLSACASPETNTNHEEDDTSTSNYVENTDIELDLRSVLDTETGAVLSLGDHRSAFEEALGTGEERHSIWDGWTHFRYVPESLGISVNAHGDRSGGLSVYFSDDIAFWIIARTDRFSFADASFDMTEEYLREHFAIVADDGREEFSLTMADLQRRYLANGEITTDLHDYSHTIHISVMNGRIYQISINDNNEAWQAPRREREAAEE